MCLRSVCARYYLCCVCLFSDQCLGPYMTLTSVASGSSTSGVPAVDVGTAAAMSDRTWDPTRLSSPSSTLLEDRGKKAVGGNDTLIEHTKGE